MVDFNCDVDFSGLCIPQSTKVPLLEGDANVKELLTAGDANSFPAGCRG
jgi:hypothetical protein